MAGNAEQVAANGLYLDGDLAGCLHGVYVKADPRLGCDLAYFFDRLKHSGFVVRHHHADQASMRTDRVAYIFGVDLALAINGQVGDLGAAVAQAVPGMQDSVVFDGCGDEVCGRAVGGFVGEDAVEG